MRTRYNGHIRMQHITFTFPQNTDSAREFFKMLQAILAQAPNSTLQDDGISFAATAPKGALPVTRFRLDERCNFPTVAMDIDERFNRLIAASGKSTESKTLTTPKQDDHGTYYEVTVNGRTGACLDISEVQKRLSGHIVRIDHLGINFLAKHMPRADWDELLRHVSSRANLYNYPTGDDWPFILPATTAEFETDITTFPIGREPKFEFVYDKTSAVPTFQFDIETNLERADIEKLFPAPYGISFPGLADYFRTVFVRHEWDGLNIRFDIRFKSTNPAGKWNTGEWLVKDGGRH